MIECQRIEEVFKLQFSPKYGSVSQQTVLPRGYTGGSGRKQIRHMISKFYCCPLVGDSATKMPQQKFHHNRAGDQSA